MTTRSNAAEDDRIVAVVTDERVGEAIDRLREEGIYDGDRPTYGVDPAEIEAEFDRSGYVAVPVSRPPESIDPVAVLEAGPPPEPPTLEAELRKRGWTDAELSAAPGSWAVVGEVVLVAIDEDVPRPEEVGEALLELHGGAHTVLERRGISGAHRQPAVSVLAGEGRTETVHTEAGTEYALDLSAVMFSPGNKRERTRMGEVASPGETVLDMFAGIGYFTLPMARAGARVTAIERNPTAFRYLLENADRNDIADRLRAYCGDCREVVPGLAAGTAFDRIVMGYYDAWQYLDPAIDALAAGGTLHLHEATPEPLVPDRPATRLREAVEAADRTIESLEHRTVKSHSEGVDHVVLTARIR